MIFKNNSIDTIPANDWRHLLPKYAAARRPVLIRDYARRWPRFEIWSMAELDRLVGSESMDVERQEEPIFRPSLGMERIPSERMSLSDYIRRISDPKADGGWYYAAKLAPPQELQVHLAAVEPGPIAGRPLESSYLWLGPAQTGTHLHYDPVNVMMVVIQGEKRFTLFPPGSVAEHGPFPLWSNWGHFSQVDLAHVDRAQFPHFPSERAIDCCVRAGDALFFPHSWWHQVVNEDLTFAASFSYTVPFFDLFRPSLLRFRVVDIHRTWSRRGRLSSAMLAAAFRR